VSNGGTAVGTAIREVLAELATAPRFTATARSGDPKSCVAMTATASGWGFAPAIDWRAGVRGDAEWYRRHAAAWRPDPGTRSMSPP
jgi:hypothetical protein